MNARKNADDIRKIRLIRHEVKAELMAKLTASVVLPIPGRAAIMISSPGLNPFVILSNVGKPVLTPALELGSIEIFSIKSMASVTPFLICSSEFVRLI